MSQIQLHTLTELLSLALNVDTVFIDGSTSEINCSSFKAEDLKVNHLLNGRPVQWFKYWSNVMMFPGTDKNSGRWILHSFIECFDNPVRRALRYCNLFTFNAWASFSLSVCDVNLFTFDIYISQGVEWLSSNIWYVIFSTRMTPSFLIQSPGGRKIYIMCPLACDLPTPQVPIWHLLVIVCTSGKHLKHWKIEHIHDLHCNQVLQAFWK